MDRLTDLGQLATLADTLPAYDSTAADRATARQAELTKPPGSLGRLEDLAVFVAGWQAGDPKIERSQALVFAGNHGVCAKGVNPFPQEVTGAMVANFANSGAAINQLCAVAGADLSVIPLDLERPTGDISESPAMSEEDALAALNAGIDAVDTGADVLCLGEMGIGNSTIAAALAAGSFGGGAAKWVGPGTGSDADGVALKARVIDQALGLHAGTLGNGAEILRCLGGRELAAICGAVLAARAARIPVILDGFICTAAVAPLQVIDPRLLDHTVVAHASAEPGHKALVEALGKAPILDLGMRLGEGSGAALALNVLRGAVACHTGMATFADLGLGA